MELVLFKSEPKYVLNTASIAVFKKVRILFLFYY